VNLGKKMLWGGLGWALGGPIGAIIGYSFASMSGQQTTNYSRGSHNRAYPKTQPGDFIVSLLVLFGAVMSKNSTWRFYCIIISLIWCSNESR